MQKYSQEVIDELDKIDILKYVSQYVTFEKKSGLYFSLCPLHNEDDESFAIYPNSNSFYCFGCNHGGGIIEFVKQYHHLSFGKAIEHLIQYSKLDVNNIKRKPSIISFLNKYAKHQHEEVIVPHIVLPIDTMNQYETTPIFEWLGEGIQQEIMDKYQVRYNPKDNSAVFPIFDNEGNIIAVKRRTLYDKYKELGIKKYMYYQKIGELDFLYGLHFNKPNIIEKNECICVEGEKSLWKLEGWGIDNAVSICTHNINRQQIKNLLQLHTNIVIAFDKDVEIQELRTICKDLKMFTNVYAILDKNNLLKAKDAPVDEGRKVFEQLYKERIKLY